MTIVESAWRKLARNEWPMCFWTALAINHLFSSKRQNRNLNRNCCQGVLSPHQSSIKTARETLSDMIKWLLEGMSFRELQKTDGSCQKRTASKWHASLHSFVYLFTWASHIHGLIHRMLKISNTTGIYTSESWTSEFSSGVSSNQEFTAGLFTSTGHNVKWHRFVKSVLQEFSSYSNVARNHFDFNCCNV